MKGTLTENLIEFIEDLKNKSASLRNQARNSLIIGNKQTAESYLRYSGIFNVAANNLMKIYLNNGAANNLMKIYLNNGAANNLMKIYLNLVDCSIRI